MSKTTNIDDIARLSDGELDRKLSTVKRLIDTSRRKREKTANLEVDFCYLKRESEIRERRRQAHAEYQQRLYRSRKHRANAR